MKLNLTRLPDDGEYMVFSIDQIHPLEPAGHTVYIHPDALVDRKLIYTLETDDDALDHIAWEHHIRLNPNGPENVIPANIKDNFDRVWGAGHKAARGKPMNKFEQNAQHLRLNMIRKEGRKRGRGRQVAGN